MAAKVSDLYQLGILRKFCNFQKLGLKYRNQSPTGLNSQNCDICEVLALERKHVDKSGTFFTLDLIKTL